MARNKSEKLPHEEPGVESGFYKLLRMYAERHVSRENPAAQVRDGSVFWGISLGREGATSGGPSPISRRTCGSHGATLPSRPTSPTTWTTCMPRNKSEREPIEKLLAYARACRQHFDHGINHDIGESWKAIGFNGRHKIDYMSRRERMLHIFAEHGTSEEKMYPGP